jgi:hypothetical protein
MVIIFNVWLPKGGHRKLKEQKCQFFNYPDSQRRRATGDAERIQDRWTDRKLGLGVFGAWVGMHNSLIVSNFY